MDVVERLTLEAAQADTMLACEHRHRYEFAAGCAPAGACSTCAAAAAMDGDPRRRARARWSASTTTPPRRDGPGRRSAVTRRTSASSSPTRSRSWAGTSPAASTSVVCFEGLEHLHELDRALALLREHAERGVRIVASVPNGKLFGEQNPFHVDGVRLRRGDRGVRAVPGHRDGASVPGRGLADLPARGDARPRSRVTLEDRDEPEYANHFIFCVGFEPSGGRARPPRPDPAQHRARSSTAGRRTSSAGRGRCGARTRGWHALGSARAARPRPRRWPRSPSARARSQSCRSAAGAAEARVRELEAVLAEIDGRRAGSPATTQEAQPRAGGDCGDDRGACRRRSRPARIPTAGSTGAAGRPRC